MKTTRTDHDGGIMSGFILFIAVIDLSSALWLSTPYQVKKPGDSLVVVCKDGNMGKAVTWRGPRDRALGEKTQPNFYVRNYGTALVFSSIRYEDAGTYTCKSETGESEEFTLVVGEPIEFIGTPSVQKGLEGTNITVACEAKRGIIEWAIDEEQPRPPKYVILGDGLLIVNLTREDGQRKYICRAVRESSGDVKEKEITVIVEHQPIWTLKYEKQDIVYGIMGEFVNLICDVESEPAPQFQWMEKNGRRKIGMATTNGMTSILKLKMTKEALGNYTCIAKNPHGKLEVHFTLTNGTIPDPPSSIQLKSAGFDHLDLEIEGPEDIDNTTETMMITGFRVEYKSKNSTEWMEKDYELAEDKAYALTGLEKNTFYQVRAATRNLAGISEFTNTSIFRTQPNHGLTISAKFPCAFSFTVSFLVYIVSLAVCPIS
ncbi:neuronal growth regulator 1-like isoform X3 [Cylas formicarius]|uniref:neuronal growth regulator 1-like isoform X3 n=1 Tax=Cylas formicarius TaxID=197179 RepID=UPI002958C629|nr:neuronal growth regulator 1-like isoform X3 [Cylas formicarius]